MEQHTDLQEIIEYLNPAELDYQDWVNVGMALKHEGYSVDVWDTWSKNDRRYHSGECEKKWNTFHGSNSPVTAGTIVQLAMEHGWKPSYTAYELGWDDEISAEGLLAEMFLEDTPDLYTEEGIEEVMDSITSFLSLEALEFPDQYSGELEEVEEFDEKPEEVEYKDATQDRLKARLCSRIPPARRM